jgi:Domain of unknown function (DUF4209)
LALVDYPLEPNDLEAANWRDILVRAERKDCWVYGRLFLEESRKKAELGEHRLQAVFQLLGQLTSMMLNWDEDGQPYRPMVVAPTGRSAVPQDMSREEAQLLKGMVPTIEDAEFLARLADVLWLVTRDHLMARTAVQAYIASAKRFENSDSWTNYFSRISRAVGLAASLRDRALVDQVLREITSVVERYQQQDSSFLTARLMEILLAYGAGDPPRYGEYAESAAMRLQASQSIKAREYWRIAAGWYSRARENQRQQSALNALSETYVSDAEAALSQNPPNLLAAVAHVEKAIEGFRRVLGSGQRIDELRGWLGRLQQDSLGELKKISSSVDVSQIVEDSRGKVRGKTLHDAILILALSGSPESVSTLRESAKRFANQFPLQYLMPAVILDSSGRKVGVRPGFSPDNPEASAAALELEMFRLASLNQTLHAQAVVEPMRVEITLTHAVQSADLVDFVSENPFVPAGRERLFLRGLHAGFEGDFVVSTHVLGLQLENSIRHVLAAAGVTVSSLDHQGIEQLKGLETLLRMPEAAEIFGEDLVFDLRGLLVEACASNLRHRLAHGLINHGEFLTFLASYLWWLTLRLCCIPVIQRRSLATGNVTPAADDSTAE